MSQQNHRSISSHGTPLLGMLIACCFGAMACGTKSTGTPTRDPIPSASTSPQSVVTTPADAGAVVTAPPADKTIPTLTLEPFAPAGTKPTALFAIEGALTVVEGQRVGRIVGGGESIDWIGKIPKTGAYGSETRIHSVNGRFPDGVGVLFETSIGRAPAPTYIALTGPGKGMQHTEAGGGGWGSIEVVRVGDTTLLAGASGFDGHRIISARGPRLVRRFLTVKSTCKPGEVTNTMIGTPDEAVPAVPPNAFESTTEGTLVSLGTLCEKRGPAAEIWDSKTGKSRIVELGSLWKTMVYPKLFKGAGDELWAFSDGFHPVLRFREGKFEPVPEPTTWPIERVFVSPSGQLHAITTESQTIYRLDEGKWTALGRVAEPREFRTLAVAGAENQDTKDTKDTKDAKDVKANALWAVTDEKVFKLREGPRVPAEETCKSWFVHLYAVASNNGSNFTFPTTRTALSTFPEVSDLGLFETPYPRHLGVSVTSKAQGEAVIAHVKANMKDEDPKLFCYRPTKARKIDISAKGK